MTLPGRRLSFSNKLGYLIHTIDEINRFWSFVSDLDYENEMNEYVDSSSEINLDIENLCWMTRIFGRESEELLGRVSPCSIHIPDDDKIEKKRTMLLLINLNLELYSNLLKYMYSKPHTYTFPMYKRCFRSVVMHLNRFMTFNRDLFCFFEKNFQAEYSFFIDMFANYLECFWIDSDPRLWLFSWIGRLSACNLLEKATPILKNTKYAHLVDRLVELIDRSRELRKRRLSAVSQSSESISSNPPDSSTQTLLEESQNHVVTQYMSILQEKIKSVYLPVQVIPSEVLVGPFSLDSCFCEQSNSSTSGDSLSQSQIGIRITAEQEPQENALIYREPSVISQGVISTCVLRTLHDAGVSIAPWLLEAREGKWTNVDWSIFWPSEVSFSPSDLKEKDESPKRHNSEFEASLIVPVLVSLLSFHHEVIRLQNTIDDQDITSAGTSSLLILPESTPGYVTMETDVSFLSSFGWRRGDETVGPIAIGKTQGRLIQNFGWQGEFVLAAFADFLGLPSCFYYKKNPKLRLLAMNFRLLPQRESTGGRYLLASDFEIVSHAHDETADIESAIQDLEDSISHSSSGGSDIEAQTDSQDSFWEEAMFDPQFMD
eukprot:GDKJ01013693.1.p1 GENE.GDKJ01013693.1~~GDKJ01013693.1.p1  ORF type:complete len:618 (+),score=92.16 GDKJ01013693.1:53-1855(+)